MSATISPPPNLSAISRSLAEACARIPTSQGPAGIARELARIAPDSTFRQALSRGGWYRLGGVVDAVGNRIADNLEHWIQNELAANGQDLSAVAAAHEGENLRATRLTGKTHYWVAGAGKGAADFIQIEIEELQEVISHALFPSDQAPVSVEDLVDPCDAHFEQTALGISFYALRHITDIGDFLRAMSAQKPEPQAIHRFVADWEASSAGLSTEFSRHWIVALREHLDRYRQTIRTASPVAALGGAAPRFESAFGARGLALSEALHRFDRQAGYPMAWFFHMLSTKAAPHAVAAVAIEDQQSGFNYLPERDLQVVRNWLHRPYGF